MFKVLLADKIYSFLESNNYLSHVGNKTIGKTNSNLVDENVFILSEEVETCHFSLFLQ